MKKRLFCLTLVIDADSLYNSIIIILGNCRFINCICIFLPKGGVNMLGTYVRVRVTNPIHSLNSQNGFVYRLNCGIIEGKKVFDSNPPKAYIVGIDYPVRTFDGRVTAVIKRNDGSVSYVVSPKNIKLICHQIEDVLSFSEPAGSYTLECLYERSCGAVVFRKINNEIRFLLIKNRRSAHWGFPKGHIERGESSEQTAKREVLEETGIHIDIVPRFALKSEYSIQGKIEKSVVIFLATTKDTKTIIQKEEIEDYIWLDYKKAMETLRFINDRNILRNANDFIDYHRIQVPD